jgi:hypothetical protein
MERAIRVQFINCLDFPEALQMKGGGVYTLNRAYFLVPFFMGQIDLKATSHWQHYLHPSNPFNQNIEEAVLFKIVQMSYLCLKVRGNCPHPLSAPGARAVSYANCQFLRYKVFIGRLVL